MEKLVIQVITNFLDFCIKFLVRYPATCFPIQVFKDRLEIFIRWLWKLKLIDESELTIRLVFCGTYIHVVMQPDCMLDIDGDIRGIT